MEILKRKISLQMNVQKKWRATKASLKFRQKPGENLDTAYLQHLTKACFGKKFSDNDYMLPVFLLKLSPTCPILPFFG